MFQDLIASNPVKSIFFIRELF